MPAFSSSDNSARVIVRSNVTGEQFELAFARRANDGHFFNQPRFSQRAAGDSQRACEKASIDESIVAAARNQQPPSLACGWVFFFFFFLLVLRDAQYE